ncbi:MAG: hypothetical protein IPG97_11010 [Microthrixaceae bacterium]|nr:hypothetical protein [Microthrixaceae bacterium]
MILVNLSKSWAEVVSGAREPADVTLGDWAGITDESIEQCADVILGVHRGEVVSAFDIEAWDRDPESGRVRFSGAPSETWAHLVGTPNPGPAWVKGAARPVKYLDTRILTEGSVEVEATPDGSRAVVRGFTLAVADDGTATVIAPPGSRVTVITGPIAG